MSENAPEQPDKESIHDSFSNEELLLITNALCSYASQLEKEMKVWDPNSEDLKADQAVLKQLIDLHNRIQMYRLEPKSDEFYKKIEEMYFRGARRYQKMYEINTHKPTHRPDQTQ